MNPLKLNCIECGKDYSPQNRFYLCSKCLNKRYESGKIPKIIDIIICTRCNARKKKKSWLKSHSLNSSIIEVVTDEIVWLKETSKRDVKICNLDSINPEDKNIPIFLELKAELEGIKISKKEEILIRIKKGLCSNCSKLTGGYYESVVQIRVSSKKRVKNAEKGGEYLIKSLQSLSLINPSIFISKTHSFPTGFDFYISDMRAAKALSFELAQEFGGKVVQSVKLMGMKDGERLFRTTYLVRLPFFSVGDFIEIGTTPHKVLKFLKKSVICKNLENFRTKQISLKIVEKTRVVGRREMEAVVVSKNEKEMQILDPETFETVTLIKPDIEIGETVSVMRYEGRLYITD